MAYRSFALAGSGTFTANFSTGNEVVMQSREVGVRFDIDLTAITGTSVTFTVEYYEQTSGTWKQLLQSAAQTAAAHVVLQIDPRIASSNNASLQAIVPKRLRVTTTGTWSSATLGIVVTVSA